MGKKFRLLEKKIVLDFFKKNRLPEPHCCSHCVACGFWVDLKRFLGVSVATVSSL